MRKVILYIAMSLDGYISRENDAIDFLGGQTNIEVDYGFDAFLDSVDTLIMGSKTYKEITEKISIDIWLYPNKEVFVFSNQFVGRTEHVKFVQGDLLDFVEKLKHQSGKDIWIIGGRGVIDPLIKHNAIDRYVITVMPILIGSGKKLFTEFESDILLKHVDTKVYDGMVMLTYEKRDPQ